MNDVRRARRRRAWGWLAGGLVAGVAGWVVTAVLVGAGTLATAVGLFCAATGGFMSVVALTALPPMIAQHRREHLEVRRIARQLETELRLLPEATDQLRDLVELDAVVRSRASTAIERIRRLYSQSAKEGRVGVFDRIKGGLKTAASDDPMTELQYMMNTLRTVLDREISDLGDRIVTSADAKLRVEQEASLKALKRQREGFEKQCQALKVLYESLRKTRETVRAVEFQAANIGDLDLDEVRLLGTDILSGLGHQVDALEQALTELRGSGADATQRLGSTALEKRRPE